MLPIVVCFHYIQHAFERNAQPVGAVWSEVGAVFQIKILTSHFQDIKTGFYVLYISACSKQKTSI